MLCRPGQLEQVLLNLAVNARDAMPAGGRLDRSRTELVTDPEPPATTCRPGRYVMLAVADTGAGMDADDAGARSSSPSSPPRASARGPGWGSRWCTASSSRTAGTSGSTASRDRDTTFRLFLPRAAAPRPVPQLPDARPARPTPEATGRVVLVVEDEEAVRHLVCRALAKQGYRVLEAGDGNEALTLAGSFGEPIDLLLTDMIMPGQNGRQVATRLTAERPGTRVLFMSGHTDGVLGQNGLIDQETTQVVRKPFTTAELIRRVEEALTGVSV